VRALAVDRVVSVSPLSIDLTARVDLGELAADLQGREPDESTKLDIRNER